MLLTTALLSIIAVIESCLVSWTKILGAHRAKSQYEGRTVGQKYLYGTWDFALNPYLKHSFMNLALHFTKLFSVKGVPVFVFLTVSLNLARMSMLSAGEPV